MPVLLVALYHCRVLHAGDLCHALRSMYSSELCVKRAILSALWPQALARATAPARTPAAAGGHIDATSTCASSPPRPAAAASEPGSVGQPLAGGAAATGTGDCGTGMGVLSKPRDGCDSHSDSDSPVAQAAAPRPGPSLEPASGPPASGAMGAAARDCLDSGSDASGSTRPGGPYPCLCLPPDYGLPIRDQSDRDRFTLLASAWALEAFVDGRRRDELMAALRTAAEALVLVV